MATLLTVLLTILRRIGGDPQFRVSPDIQAEQGIFEHVLVATRNRGLKTFIEGPDLPSMARINSFLTCRQYRLGSFLGNRLPNRRAQSKVFHLI